MKQPTQRTRKIRRLVLAAVMLCGIALGAITTTALTEPDPPSPGTGSEPTVATPRSTARASATVEGSPDRPGVLLVWTSGGLPPAFGEAVAALSGVERVSMVRGDETRMAASHDADGRPVDVPRPGWHLPLDTLAVEQESFSSFLEGDAAEAVRALTPGQALLTETSARLRRLGAGATLRLAETDVEVAGVIDDPSGAGAEVLVTAEDADRVAVTTPRYLLVAHSGDRDVLQRAIAERLGGRAVRFRSPAETAWLRHGDAVEPTAVVKAGFGEFAVRDRSRRSVEIDPAWVARWIVTEPVPVLGSVTCHRKAIGALRAAITDLQQANLAHLVQASAFAGCYNARRIAEGQPLSHHAWGAAVDLNVDGNPRGSFSTQDPRLVQTMARHGFTWGGTWLVPDPAHYEAPLPSP